MLRSVPIDFKKTPHSLFVGGSGSGKTTALKLLLGKVALYEPQAKAILCDFKGDKDFSFLGGCDHFYRYDNVTTGITTYFEMFRKRQSGEVTSRAPRFLVIDEYASYLNYLDKKDAEDVKKKIAVLLMMGRSFNCYTLVAVQRCDADYFGKARDNFSLIIAMGTLSKESSQMVGLDRETAIPVTAIGGGHIVFNGSQQVAIQVPKVKDLAKLNRAIYELVSR